MSKSIFSYIIGTSIGVYSIRKIVNSPKPKYIYCPCHEYCNNSGYVNAQNDSFGRHTGYSCDCVCHE